jgi:hypothetical protein
MLEVLVETFRLYPGLLRFQLAISQDVENMYTTYGSSIAENIVQMA